MRSNAAEAYGTLCAVSNDPTFLTANAKRVIAYMVSHTDANSRAGCAQFLGSAIQEVGALSSKTLIRSAADVVISLVKDPHPLVHYWALRSLTKIVLTCGLEVQPYLKACVDASLHVCSAKSHDTEEQSESLAVIGGGLPVLQAACLMMESLVGSLGPALAESPDDLAVIKTLATYLAKDGDNRCATESNRVLQRILLICPTALRPQSVIDIARQQLGSTDLSVRAAAVDTTYHLVQREVSLMSRLGGDEFVRHLLAIFDESPDLQGVWHTLRSWIEQTKVERLLNWISVLQAALHSGVRRSDPRQSKIIITSASRTDEDEESLGLGTALDSSAGAKRFLRWQTQALCLRCLRLVLRSIADSEPYNLNRKASNDGGASSVDVIVSAARRIPDLIKIAFAAISGQSTHVRLQGLETLDVIIKVRPCLLFVRLSLSLGATTIS